MNTILDIKSLSVNYDNDKVINNINWMIEEGSYNFLLGGNGSGKSTLIKSIIGLIPIKTGEILYNGNPITRKNISDNFGYVPQYSNIKRDFPISVEEIIRLECSLANKTCPISPEGHLKTTGVSNLLKKKISELSGGELQKVLIARGLVTHPKILILDEPTNNLDKQSRKSITDLFYKLNKEENTTIIHITHDIHEVEETKETKKFILIDGYIKEYL